jgi:hypothetical protein
LMHSYVSRHPVMVPCKPFPSIRNERPGKINHVFFMILPIIASPLTGVIWYQKESMLSLKVEIAPCIF